MTCHGGELSPVRPWNGSPGTRIEVRHLFYNTPVRRKFLRTHHRARPRQRDGHAAGPGDIPALHLVLRHNGKLVYDVPASAGLLDRIGLFFGQEVARRALRARGRAGPGRADRLHRRPVLRARQRQAAVPVPQRPLDPRPQPRPRPAGSAIAAC